MHAWRNDDRQRSRMGSPREPQLDHRTGLLQRRCSFAAEREDDPAVLDGFEMAARKHLRV